MRPTLEDLKAIWLLSYSRSAFIDASKWLDKMEVAAQDRSNYEASNYEALAYAAVVTYCRPFTKSQVTPTERVIPLRGVLPPAHLAVAHENLLHLRNEYIGHKDAVPTEGYSSSPNMVILHRVEKGIAFHTTRLGPMEIEQLKAVKELCSHFRQHCETNLRPLTRKYHPELMRYPEGDYELLITEPPNEWLKPRVFSSQPPAGS
jgi:hypothetical protein